MILIIIYFNIYYYMIWYDIHNMIYIDEYVVVSAAVRDDIDILCVGSANVDVIVVIYYIQCDPMYICIHL